VYLDFVSYVPVRLKFDGYSIEGRTKYLVMSSTVQKKTLVKSMFKRYVCIMYSDPGFQPSLQVKSVSHRGRSRG
jgi:hypothetical protein